MSSLPVLKILQDKPALAEELTYKLKIEVTNRVLLNSKNFYNFPKCKMLGSPKKLFRT